MRDILFTGLTIALIYVATLFLLWINSKVFTLTKQSRKLHNIQPILQNIKTKIHWFLILVSTLAVLALLGFNLWIFYQKKSISVYTLAFLQKVPSQTWINLGLGIIKSLSIFLLIAWLNKAIIAGLRKACISAQNFDDIKGNDESIAKFFATAQTGITNSLWLVSLKITFIFLNVPKIINQSVYAALKIYVIFSIGTLLLRSVTIGIDTLDALTTRLSPSNQLVQVYGKFRHLLGFFRRCLEAIIAISFTTFAIRQIEVLANLAIFGNSLVKVVAIIFLSRVAVEISKLLIQKLMYVNEEQTLDSDKGNKMRSTFFPLVESVVKYLIFFFSGIFILYALGINPLPILAAAGILGVGISLGAQTLIKDIIAGFFILFEGHFLVGDYVKIGKVSGYVQAIELRTTRIRNPQGHHQIIRNGDIDQVTNYTKESWNKLMVEFGVSYQANLDHVYKIIEEIGQELENSNPNVLEGTKIRRIEDFRKHDILISTATTIIPDTAVGVSGQLRKLIKERLQRASIEQPYAKNLIFNHSGDN